MSPYAPGFSDEDMARRDAAERARAAERAAQGPWANLGRRDAKIPVPPEPPLEPPAYGDWAAGEQARRTELEDAARQSAQARGLHLGSAADANEEGALGLYSLMGVRVPRTVVNPDYEHRQRFVGTMRGALDRSSEAQGRIDESAKGVNLVGVEAADALADAEQHLYVRRQARLYEQEELANETVARSRRNLGLAEKGAERMMSAPAIDPNRWWASRTAGQRAMATVALIARGLGGRDVATSPIFAAIDRDIDAQKATFAQLGAATAAAQNNTNLAFGLYSDIRAKIGDEREADEIYRLAKLQAVKSQFEAMAARVGLPGMQAQIDQSRAEFDMAIAQQRETVDTIAAHNVRKRTVMVPALQAHRLADGRTVYTQVGGPGTVKAADYLAREAAAGHASSRKIVEGVAEAQGRIGVAQATEQAKAQAKVGGLAPGESKTIASDDVQDLVSVIKAMDRWSAKYATDVPNQTEFDLFGRGFSGPVPTHDEREEKALRTQITAVLKNKLLGKTMTALEVEGVLASMPSDADSGDMRRERMAAARRMMVDKLDTVGAALGPEGKARLRDLVPRAVLGSGVEDMPGSLEEDAEALEGTYR